MSKLTLSLAFCAALLALGACATSAPRYATELPPAGAEAPPPPPSHAERSSPPRAAPVSRFDEAVASPPRRSRAAPAEVTAPGRSGGAPVSRPPVMATPRQVTVAQGETLADIAERWRTPVPALIEANRLEPPYALTPGQRLTVPQPLVYVARDGDTLFGVARRFAMDPRSLANLNDITLETPLADGRRLALPSLARDGGANAQAAGATPAGMATGPTPTYADTPAPRLRGDSSYAAPTPRAPRKTEADARAAVAAAASRSPTLSGEGPTLGAAGDGQVAQAGRGRFVWPLKGALLSGFGPKGPGLRNDGVDLAAEAGAPVRAAAAGEVVYAGSAIAAFGNLVLVKHPGGWVTAYGHLAKIAVAMRQTVAQGQEIGEAGQTGSVAQPQLHFEVRYTPSAAEAAKPIDPALVLPRAG